MDIGTSRSPSAVINKLRQYYSRADLLQERDRVLRFYLLGDCATDLNYRVRQPLQNQNNKFEVIDNFIDSTHQSLMLIIGDAGVGKSAFTQWLVNYFCKHSTDKTYPGFLPIRIELKSYSQQSVKGAIADALKNQFKFSAQEIEELKQLPDVIFMMRLQVMPRMIYIKETIIISLLLTLDHIFFLFVHFWS